MSLRCLIVDDEPLARHLLTDYVGKVSFEEGAITVWRDYFDSAYAA